LQKEMADDEITGDSQRPHRQESADVFEKAWSLRADFAHGRQQRFAIAWSLRLWLTDVTAHSCLNYALSGPARQMDNLPKNWGEKYGYFH
jgi:hypothetical protein